jgi:hypothetical protein
MRQYSAALENEGCLTFLIKVPAKKVRLTVTTFVTTTYAYVWRLVAMNTQSKGAAGL